MDLYEGSVSWIIPCKGEKGPSIAFRIRLNDENAEAGFVEIPVDHARKALQNGLVNVSAIYNGELVGMGRLVGDGAMYWYLQEIIILPRFQRKGIGTMIVNHLVDYAKANSATGKFTTVGGVSAKGKEPFYEKMGFEIIPNGIKKMIEIE